MSARIVGMIIAALLGGLLLGRLGPQADLRRLRERVDTLQQDLASRDKPRAGRSLAGVQSLFNVSAQDMEAGAKARRARAEATLPATNAVTATNAVAAAVEPAPPAATQRWDRASISNQVERAKEAWTMRAAIARRNFIAENKLDDQKTLEFDAMMEAMNLRLGASIDKWTATIADEQTLRPETGLRMMTELGTALVLTYDELDRRLPPEWRQNTGPNFELVNFVDPEVLTPLQDLENVVTPADANAGGRRHHRHPLDSP
jgi:hypothetical protein